MQDFDNISVIIPSYDPDEKLVPTVEGLLSEGFSDIIIIDDGSKPETQKFFPANMPGVTILRHDTNRGKGAGLKTAFRFVLDNRPNSAGCVTADSDGQHKPSDIASCVRDMLDHPDCVVLGARDFSLPHVPERSRKGNRITSRVFRLLFGMKISDTQTGLRVFPRSTLPDMLEVRGDRYEYETNMLISMKRSHIPFREVGIETVYIDDNATSHFRPVRDSIRIYGLILSFAFSSVISAIIDIGLFTVFNVIFTHAGIGFHYGLSVICARVISSGVNYLINRRAVFGTGDKNSVKRYYILAALILALSTAIGQGITHIIPSDASWIQTLVKTVVDVVMFILSFRIQNEWVFGKKKTK